MNKLVNNSANYNELQKKIHDLFDRNAHPDRIVDPQRRLETVSDVNLLAVGSQSATSSCAMLRKT